MTGRRLLKSDLAIVKAVYRRYRAEGIDPDAPAPWSNPGGADLSTSAGPKHVARLRAQERLRDKEQKS